MNYSPREIMVLAAARQIKNKDIVLCGTGLSMLAAVAAKHIYAPESTIFFESGAIDSGLAELPLAVADSRVMYKAANFCSLVETFSFMQNKKTGTNIVGIIGAAQIDPYGNLNSTMIGSYDHTKVRFAGSGGACDLSCFVGSNIIFMEVTKQKFVKKLSYLTSPGWIQDDTSRDQSKIAAKGPSIVVTDMGIMGFDKKSKKMFLKEYYPGINPEDIQKKVGFDIDISRAVPLSEPKNGELKILREKTDPEKLILD
ncbi:MAG: ketoacid-CoA transferase [Desulfobacteraceae bacterium]|nr:ketoacid-CoA transferase [Desulfobacteraceae bacterium]